MRNLPSFSEKPRVTAEVGLVFCLINDLPCVIPIPPQREKESLFKIATPACQSHPPAVRPACHNKALRFAGTSLSLLEMTWHQVAIYFYLGSKVAVTE